MHTPHLNQVRFSPDGSMLASVDNDEFKINVWSSITRTLVTTLVGHHGLIRDLRFDPRGSNIVTSDIEGNLYVWDIRTQQILHRISTSEGLEGDIAFSADGRFLAANHPSNPNEIAIFETRMFTISSVLSGHANTVFSIAFSPDGTELASSAADEKVRIWNIATQRSSHEIDGFLGAIRFMGSSRYGNLVAIVRQDQLAIEIWDMSQKQRILTLTHDVPITGISFSPDATLLAIRDRIKLQLWSIPSGELISTFQPPVFRLNNVTFSLDHQSGRLLLTGSSNNVISVWDVYSRERVRSIYFSSGSIGCIDYSFDFTYMVVCKSGERPTFNMYDVVQGKEDFFLVGPAFGVSYPAISPDNQFTAFGGRGAFVRLWDRQDNDSIVLTAMSVTDLTFSPLLDGIYTPLLFASSAHHIMIWDYPWRNEPRVIELMGGNLTSIEFTSNGRLLLAASDDGTIRILGVPR